MPRAVLTPQAAAPAALAFHGGGEGGECACAADGPRPSPLLHLVLAPSPTSAGRAAAAMPPVLAPLTGHVSHVVGGAGFSAVRTIVALHAHNNEGRLWGAAVRGTPGVGERDDRAP